jgi:hypothetical protein
LGEIVRRLALPIIPEFSETQKPFDTIAPKR